MAGVEKQTKGDDRVRAEPFDFYGADIVSWPMAHYAIVQETHQGRRN
jgi:hypothetical protein